MSISSALSSTLSGLTASSRNAQVVSSNLANALTPGYATRELELSTQGPGRGGVKVQGVIRQADAGLIGDRRMADASLAYSGVQAGFMADLERLTGTPDAPGSLSSRVSVFEASLVTAAAKPEEETRLQAAVQRAGELAQSLNDLSRQIQNLRTEAETKIERTVNDANTYLGQVEALNARITDATNAGHPTASFEDRRRVVIDKLAELIPVRMAPRDNGGVALYTPGGAALLDGRASELGFTASNVVMPHMTLAGGLLDGLAINGIDVPPSGDRSPVDGGRLAGLFELRDRLAPDAQTQLDAIARDLVTRFQAAGLDASRPPGTPGLFTDAGGAFDPVDEIGLSGRVTVNLAVDPDQGGMAWRLRDGLGAAAPGAAGDATLLQALSAAFSAPTDLTSGGLGSTQRDISGHVSSMASHFGQKRLTLDQTVAFASAHQAGLREIELEQGVDTDAEMQKLLLIEQAYSANARMIGMIDDMIETLLRI